MERGSMNSRGVKESSQTAEGEMLNIGIVELPPGAESKQNSSVNQVSDRWVNKAILSSNSLNFTFFKFTYFTF